MGGAGIDGDEDDNADVLRRLDVARADARYHEDRARQAQKEEAHRAPKEEGVKHPRRRMKG